MVDMSGQIATKRVYPRVDPEATPVIEHWITLPDAAIELGISRQQAYNLAAAGHFRTLRKLSKRGKPQFLIKRSELAAYMQPAPA